MPDRFSYALASKIETTETFKAKRRAYVDQGFNPESIEDPLYVFDGHRQAFVVLDVGTVCCDPKPHDKLLSDRIIEN